MKQNTARTSRWWGTAVVIILLLIGTLLAPAWRGKTISQAGTITDMPGNKTVFIGVSGVTWADISAEKTPTLYDFVGRGSSANLVVKTIGVTTCPNAGWLTISQGVRAADPIEKGCAKPITAATDGVLPARVEKARIAGEATSPFTPPETTFGDELASRGMSVGTIGSGAALALRTSTNLPAGQRHHANITYTNGIATHPAAVYPAVSQADLVVVDLGRVTNTSHAIARAKGKGMLEDMRAAFAPPVARSVHATAQISALDRELGELLDVIDPNTTIMIGSVADSDSRTAQLQFMSAAGPGITPGTVSYTNSTRHRGLVQLTDIPQALLTLLGQQPIADFVGSPIAFHNDDAQATQDIVAELRDNNARAIAVRPAVGPFYLLMSISAGIFLIGSLVRWWRLSRAGKTAILSNTQRAIALTIALLPAASFLANLMPWWNTPVPTAAFLGCILGISIAGAALSRRTPCAAGCVALISATTIGLDVVLGSVLHSSSVLGDQPQQGGRFYGLSNAPFTVFALSMIYLAFVAARILRTRYEQVAVPAAVMALGIIAVVIDGAGSLGADFGGVPALVAAFLVLLVVMGGRALTPRTFIIIFGTASLVGIGAAFVDWLRPQESWTHLGRFFQSIIDGEAINVVYRKLMFMLGSAPWFVWLLLAIIALAMWIWRDQIRVLTLSAQDSDIRWVIRAMVTLVVVGVALNDSGLVILLLGAAYGAPLVMATDTRHHP
ncbi:hypothetical protein [Arcanobacterium phocae]|uniref:hypothetical protein n=1 Tax=Arcanobacterium phocae TaxID=131112 RepID=UPI001C0EF7AD|nr:hypothetical protein [Arcanobacterium phocae]